MIASILAAILKGAAWFFYVLGYVLWLAVKYLFVGLWRLVCLPFKGIARLVRRGKKE